MSAAILAVTAMLAAPALYNGYPLVFSDTAAYVSGGIPENRAFGYGVFLLLTGFRRTLWLSVVVQSAMCAAILWIVLRSYRPPRPVRTFVATGVALALGTTLPWFTAQLMPDFLSPLDALCVLLLVVRWPRLAPPERFVAGFVLAFACLAHYSNLLLTGALLGLVLAWAALRRDRRWARAALRGAVPLAVACLGAYAGNYVKSRELILTRGGHVFMLGRLAESGILQRLLADRCGQTPYLLCPYRTEIPDSLELFMFDKSSPLAKVGWMRVPKEPAQRMVRDAIRYYPGAFVGTSLRNSARQFVTFRTGDGWHSYRLSDPRYLWTPAMIKALVPRDYPAFSASLQQRDALPVAVLRGVHGAVEWAGLAASAAVLAYSLVALRRGRGGERGGPRAPVPAVDLHALVWTAAVLNAGINATLTTVTDRVQARMVWLFVFACLVSLTARRARERPVAESPASTG